MSYSNWINSKWSTLWAASLSSESKRREDQVFEISGIINFTYGQIKEFGLSKCIKMVKDKIKNPRLTNMLYYDIEDYYSENFQELKLYIVMFMKDVERSNLE